MRVSKNFTIQEFVPPEIYEKWGNRSIWFIRPQIIELAQFYRDHFDKPVTINNWATGGGFNYRGFRPPGCTVGAKLSQHRFGNGFDCSVSGLTADEARAEIMANAADFMDAGLTTLESGQFAKTWVHSDCRTTGMDSILIVGN